MSTHSKIGASGMYRWSQCPGSVALSAGLPDSSSSYAREGTAAHELAEAALTGSLQAPSFVGLRIGTKKDGFDVTEEMAEAVQVYLDAVRECPGELLIEHKFDLSAVHPGLFGTADAVVLDRERKRLHVFDYKHGAGVAVAVENNPQLLYYALGALLTVGKNAPVKTVEIVIVQPRCDHPDGPVRRWEIEAVDLIDFASDLVKFAKATEEKDAPLNPGHWCKFCKAVAICPRLKKDALDMFDKVGVPEEGKPYDLAAVAEALRKFPAIEAWIAGVREFAYAAADRGEEVPGFKLVDKQARRQWVGEDREVAAMIKTNFPAVMEESLTTVKMKGLTDVENIIAITTGMKKKDVGPALATFGITKKESSGTTLVPVEDKRPAVTGKTTADDFS